ncbi:hypothetical protein DDR56_13855 [Halomonas venusta]|uniref:Secreted protein n=1 Tax=Vreelandella venusta TaxID=44935 RepID=A0ABX2BGG3_9GAMM|nr:hypothetical protein [Halomonas venusta]
MLRFALLFVFGVIRYADVACVGGRCAGVAHAVYANPGLTSAGWAAYEELKIGMQPNQLLTRFAVFKLLVSRLSLLL